MIAGASTPEQVEQNVRAGERQPSADVLAELDASRDRLACEPRALIIGGSVGGLFAANMLRSTGWDVSVFERNPEELTGRGAGISTHPQLHGVTKRLGIPFDNSMGIRSTAWCSSTTTAAPTTAATPSG